MEYEKSSLAIYYSRASSDWSDAEHQCYEAKRCGAWVATSRQVKLSQYRAAAGAGGDSGGEQEQEKIARALLSNTDKEVIFDGLKKLYRKKVREASFCEPQKYLEYNVPSMPNASVSTLSKGGKLNR